MEVPLFSCQFEYTMYSGQKKRQPVRRERGLIYTNLFFSRGLSDQNQIRCSALQKRMGTSVFWVCCGFWSRYTRACSSSNTNKCLLLRECVVRFFPVHLGSFTLPLLQQLGRTDLVSRVAHSVTVIFVYNGFPSVL